MTTTPEQRQLIDAAKAAGYDVREGRPGFASIYAPGSRAAFLRPDSNSVRENSDPCYPGIRSNQNVEQVFAFLGLER